MSKQYWYCIIGPTDTKDIEYYGGDMDYPLRDSIKNTYSKYFDHPEKCLSGWYISQEKFTIIKELLNKNNYELRKLLNLLEKEKHNES